MEVEIDQSMYRIKQQQTNKNKKQKTCIKRGHGDRWSKERLVPFFLYIQPHRSEKRHNNRANRGAVYTKVL